jgi:4-amino-4-deoxychorismate lyase
LDGVFYNLDQHWKRIVKTTFDHYGHAPSFDLRDVLGQDVPESGLYKARLIYGPVFESIAFDSYQIGEISSLEIVFADGLDYGYKYCDRGQIVALKESSGADDIIIVQNGLVTDSSKANLVFASPAGFFTPEPCLLPGTKRQSLLELGVIKRKDIKLADLADFDRVYLINAMIDLSDQVSLKIADLTAQGAR